MKLTVFQKTTIALWGLYVIWEIVVQIWSQTEDTAVIRADLFLIFPVLLVFSIISLVQYFRRK